jgi:hypothetical protein
MAYLPTVEFGPGMTSATEIRAAWPNLNEKRKTALVMSLYPATQKNPKLAVNVVKMLDTAMGVVDEIGQGVAEASDRMQRYGQLILKLARAARDAEPEPKKQQPPALSSISTRELMQQLKKPKNKNVAAAPDYMEENIKRE